jgi:hypothetical protein
MYISSQDGLLAIDLVHLFLLSSVHFFYLTDKKKIKYRSKIMTTITPIINVSDGGRFNIKGNACNVRSKKYSGGEMMLFDVEDSTATIPAIVWADAYDVFNKVIVEGNTYKFMNMQVRTNPRSSRMEIKLYKDSTIENCSPMKIRRHYSNVSDASKNVATAYISAILCDIGEDGEKTKNDEPMRRATIIDQTGELSCFIVGELALKPLIAGDQYNMGGNISSNGSMFVTSLEAVETPNVDLSQFWETQMDSRPNKKARIEPTLSTISSVKNAKIGEVGNFVCVIHTTLVTPIEMSAARIKYTYRVVDKSMSCVELGFFTSKEDPVPLLAIGDVIQFKGSVSPYNTRSLTTSVMPSKIEDDDLASWWLLSKSDEFVEISIDNRINKADA